MTTIAPTRFTCPVEWSVETRNGEGNQLRIKGHAAVFDSPARIGDFTEEIAPGAFRNALSRAGFDAFLYMGHDTDKILARVSASTLRISEDARGLAFEADVVPTSLGQDTALLVRSGHLSGCSFSFTIAPDGDTWTRRDGKPHRRITEVGELFELTLTSIPAYEATSVEGRSSLAALKARARAVLEQERSIRTQPVSPYGVDSQYSYFRDLGLVALSQARVNKAIDAGWRAGANLLDEELIGARARLDAEAERRDLSSTAGAGGEFIPAGPGVPTVVADAFATANRARGVMARVLQTRPITEFGMKIETPRFTTGATVASQPNQGDAVSNTDPGTALVEAPVVTLAGHVDLSLQLLERSAPNMDEALASELGEALGTERDRQVLNGPGTGGQLTGLLNAAGISSTSYTDATPTAAEAVAKLWASFTAVSNVYGGAGLTTIMHPRRFAFFEADTTLNRLSYPGGSPVLAPAMPANLGAGTNEDAVLELDGTETILYMQQPIVVVVFDYAESNLLKGRVLVRQYAALLVRRPASIGKVIGTGLVTPVL